MDSITQAILGASVGEAVLGKKIGNKAAILGAIGGTIPDLDVLLVPFFSELEKISLHRGYSHSILFCLLGATLFAWLLGKIKWTKDVPFGRRWQFSFLALFTHVLLDAFTSYGTQLFLPFSDYRVSFDSISIIDPVYTLPLLIGLIVSLRKNQNAPSRRWWNYAGLAISSLYLLFTLFHKKQVKNHFAEQLKKENIEWQRLLTVPVSVANLEWYGVANDGQNLYLKKHSPLPGRSIGFDKFPINEQLLSRLDPYLVDRMKWFAQGFYTVAEQEGKIRVYNMQCDMQGVRHFGEYRAPTAFYYEITPKENGDFELTSGMHPREVVGAPDN